MLAAVRRLISFEPPRPAPYLLEAPRRFQTQITAFKVVMRERCRSGYGLQGEAPLGTAQQMWKSGQARPRHPTGFLFSRRRGCLPELKSKKRIYSAVLKLDNVAVHVANEGNRTDDSDRARIVFRNGTN